MTDYDGYCGKEGTRNPEEPASAAYVPESVGKILFPDDDPFLLDQAEAAGIDRDAAREALRDEALRDDDPAELELEDRAELAVINGEYPDVEAFYASRCNHTAYSGSHPMYHLDLFKNDIIALLAYNWADEEDDYNLHENEDDTHIFKTMQRIASWIGYER